jgi:hypothetical protein
MNSEHTPSDQPEAPARSQEPIVLHPNRAKCNTCGWRGERSAALSAPNPFDPKYNIEGCPFCKDVECLVQVCDEPGCWEETTCGTPIHGGYRRTCGNHCPPYLQNPGGLRTGGQQ